MEPKAHLSKIESLSTQASVSPSVKWVSDSPTLAEVAVRIQGNTRCSEHRLSRQCIMWAINVIKTMTLIYDKACALAPEAFSEVEVMIFKFGL